MQEQLVHSYETPLKIFPKCQRLLLNAQFKYVFEHGYKVVLRNFIVLAVKRTQLDKIAEVNSEESLGKIASNHPAEFNIHDRKIGNLQALPRIGIIASRKVGNAVVRNRVKRMMREIFRLNWRQAYSILQSLDLVIITKKQAAQVTYQDLEAEFYYALRRLSKEFGEGK